MENLTTTHWFLAIAGAALHILLKLAENQKKQGFTFGGFVKENLISIVSTMIMIPVLLIVVSDSSLSDILPINNVTSLLAGYQTQSMFKNLVNIGKNKYIKN